MCVLFIAFWFRLQIYFMRPSCKIQSCRFLRHSGHNPLNNSYWPQFNNAMTYNIIKSAFSIHSVLQHHGFSDLMDNRACLDTPYCFRINPIRLSMPFSTIYTCKASIVFLRQIQPTIRSCIRRTNRLIRTVRFHQRVLQKTVSSSPYQSD